MRELIEKVREKKQFSELPDSVVSRALEKVGEDVKDARSLLRKYFGVFLINRVLKGADEGILKNHLSTRDRDYADLYKRIFDVVGGDLRFSFEDNINPPTHPKLVKRKSQSIPQIQSVIDLGCGVNGFSYKFFPEEIVYVGVEGVGQLVDLTNNYFRDRGLEKAHVFHKDLFDIDFVIKILKGLEQNKPRVVFMFQIIDALEFFEKNFSKNFLLKVTEESEFVVLSFALRSLSGKKRFEVDRKWLVDFVGENFEILDSFQSKNEKYLILKNKK